MTSQLAAIQSVLAAFPHERPLVVSDIGSQSGWVKASGDDPANLYLSGPMGQASSVALGLALARPDKRVVAFCGDGALAMNASSLFTIHALSPRNLTVVVLANDIYEYTDSLPTPSSGLDWTAVCRGFAEADRVFDNAADYASALSSREGPFFVALKIAPSEALPPGLGVTPLEIKARFLEALKT